jgi:hypothetical protein
MVSLLALPFPKGGSLGGTPWLEVCAIAPAANTELNATAKRNFFTIFSVVFRAQNGDARVWTRVPIIILSLRA